MPKTKVSKEQAQDDKLFRIRHSAAHIMAAAFLDLYPGSKLGTGPATEDGFFYDILTPQPITDKDLPKIEKKMQKIIDGNPAFSCKNLSVEDATTLFKDKKQPYKVELIHGLKDKGNKDVSIYETGKVFLDLCGGPHVDSAKEVRAFKLLSVAGAYWKGDESNQQMTRIYGTAFASQKELDEHLKLLEEAKKRDHKKLGQELDLFTFSPLVGSGLPLWTPRGTIMRNVLDDFVWELRAKHGYQKVEIPHITKKELYVVSGHWDKFQDALYKIITRENHLFAVKPMNCPHHTQIYNRKKRSYRDLPVRYANTTMVYRDEQTGELSGLTRVLAITQDDAHVFCRYSQVKDEIYKIWDIVNEFYGAIGLDLKIDLSLSDPEHPENYLGDRKVWSKAESEMRGLIKAKKIDFNEVIGEAAFYGPKIDFIAQDSLKRKWQVATIQLDMNLPERFDLNCTNEDGNPERIVIIHAAIMGSIERYLANVIEHYAGAFPVWLAPVQVTVLPISEKQQEAAGKAAEMLKSAGLRVDVDADDETIGKRIRRAELLKVPYALIIGKKEVAANKVAVRKRSEGDIGMQDLEAFVKTVRQENDTKAH